LIQWVLIGTTKFLNLLQLETSKKGCQANLGWSVGGPPEVQFACIEPLLDLSSRDRFREGVFVECDHINLSATTGAPGQDCFCAPNDQQHLSLNGDPGCSRGWLHLVNLGCVPGSNARMLLEYGIKSL
jgi:hypothetical protein